MGQLTPGIDGKSRVSLNNDNATPQTFSYYLPPPSNGLRVPISLCFCSALTDIICENLHFSTLLYSSNLLYALPLLAKHACRTLSLVTIIMCFYLDRDAIFFLGICIVAPSSIIDTDAAICHTVTWNYGRQEDNTPVPLDLAISTFGSTICEAGFYLIIQLAVMFFVLNYLSIISLLVQWLYLDHTWPIWRVLFPSLADHPLAMFCFVTCICLLPLVIAFFPCRFVFSCFYNDVIEYLHLRKTSQDRLKTMRHVKKQITRTLFVYTGSHKPYGIFMLAFRYPDTIWVSCYRLGYYFKRNELQILAPQETLPGLITGTLELDGFKLELEFSPDDDYASEQNQPKSFTYGIKNVSLFVLFVSVPC